MGRKSIPDDEKLKRHDFIASKEAQKILDAKKTEKDFNKSKFISDLIVEKLAKP